VKAGQCRFKTDSIVGERVTTPAPDAPLVFPSVAFRPALLLTLCAILAAVVIALSAVFGHAVFGGFFEEGDHHIVVEEVEEEAKVMLKSEGVVKTEGTKRSNNKSTKKMKEQRDRNNGSLNEDMMS
jgi:hypothetical protein